MHDYNKYFCIGDHIGKVLSEEQYQCLIADGKIWLTSCRLNGIDAAKAMNKDLSEFAIDERTYGGEIFADTEEEALVIANQRGYGETIQGQLTDIIPQDHKLINTTAITKEQLN